MVKWSMELSEFSIEFHPRKAIKAQALANFIVEFTFTKPTYTEAENAEAVGITMPKIGNASESTEPA